VQLIAQLENTQLDSDEPDTPCDVEDYTDYRHEIWWDYSWLGDEGVLDSSDDIDLIPDSDDSNQ
jgi:hypothetical protein